MSRKAQIDRRKWTMTVEVTGVFRGPLYKPGDHLPLKVDEDAVNHLLYRALTKMEAAANDAGGMEIRLGDGTTADCGLRLHFRDPRDEREIS